MFRGITVVVVVVTGGCLSQVGFGEPCSSDHDCAGAYRCDAEAHVCSNARAANDAVAPPPDDATDAGDAVADEEGAADAGTGNAVDELLDSLPDAGL